MPIDEIAKKLGVTPDVASQAVQEGGAVILAGLQSQTQTPEGAAKLEKALKKHESATDGTVNIDDVDTADGQKILGHIFGSKQKKVEQTLTEEPATAGLDFSKILPVLAPIVMGYLANKNQQQQQQQQQSSGGGLGGIIGNILGSTAQAGGGGLGGILGGLMGGGGGQQNSGGGLGGLLGGLLGR